MFGDNFTDEDSRGSGRAPASSCYDDDYNVLGIPTLTGIASEGHRRQLWEYPHANPEYSTILPCDFIRVGDVVVCGSYGHSRTRQRTADGVLAVAATLWSGNGPIPTWPYTIQVAIPAT